MPVKDLLNLQARALTELKSRGIVRTANNPSGDLAEYLFCKAFGWKMSENSKKGFDAQDYNSARYQIKARRIINNAPSERELSALRNLEANNFDYLATVLFKADYSIFRGAIIPYSVIIDLNPYYSKHDNKHIFYLKDNVWNIDGVMDVTNNLIEVLNNL